jgi:hypothetical protein
VISPGRRIFALFCAALLFAQTVGATTVVPPTFRQLVEQAELIVRAEVRAVRCEETLRNGRSVIHTYVKIAVLRSLKGDAPAEMELRVLGGTVGDRTLHVAGVPRFAPGEKCLLFIENNGEQFCPLVAIMYGRYRVERRTSDGVEVVRRDNGAPLRTQEDVSVPMGASLPALAAGAAQANAGMTLADFENSIATELTHVSAQNQ